MQSRDAAGRGEREPRDGRVAVGAEHELRGLHLHLESEAAVRQAVRPLERLGGVDHRLHLRDGRHLRQREHQAVGQPALIHERRQEQVERADAASPRRRLERLEADPDERRGEVGAGRGGDALRRTHGVGVLEVVAAVAVAVLEVDPQVLDRLPCELLLHEGRHGCGDIGCDADVDGERLHAARSGSGLARRPPPLDQQLGGVPVGGHVDGVHRLARAVVARVGVRQQPIGRRETGVDRGEDDGGQGGAHAHSSSSYAGSVRKST